RLFLDAPHMPQSDGIPLLARQIPMKRDLRFKVLFESAAARQLQQKASKESHGSPRQYPSDSLGEPVPGFLLLIQQLLPASRNAVVLRFAVVLGRAPARLDCSVELQPV